MKTSTMALHTTPKYIHVFWLSTTEIIQISKNFLFNIDRIALPMSYHTFFRNFVITEKTEMKLHYFF